MSEGNISEDDLQAYVDGRLDAVRAFHVEHYLERNPDAAARIAAYIEQKRDLRAAFENVMLEPDFGGGMELSRVAPGRAYRRPLFQAMAAAILLGFIIGGGSGWMVRGHMMPAPLTGISALTQEAVANHLVFTEDHGRPVELAADQQADLVRWLSKRLNAPVIVPDLRSAGYQFMGGRLAATDHGPAAMLMYVDASGERLTVFTRPMPWDKRKLNTIPISADGVSGFAWICDGRGYSVLQTDDRASLRSVADIVRRQVDPS
jgi:anti-sigma factor RsiW